ncbi:MAG TPA: c-type cytochrome [Aquifex aeolicus]|uniref:C-type cytochrome n=1 Tax=Aquifex aeolicus TaxID=63363 RepID=A0A7C5Q2T4_AQUAO|nr:c-type cytochrome [Aquifex aeolicus]
MKGLLLSLGLAGLVFAGGESIFNSKGCNACHKPDQDTPMAPSLKTIQGKYGGDVDAMVKYLKGQGSPKVWPEKAAIMNPQLDRLKGLSDSELKALAEYMLGK